MSEITIRPLLLPESSVDFGAEVVGINAEHITGMNICLL